MAEKNSYRTWLVCCLIALGTAVVYWPVATFSFASIDDGYYVIGNAHVNRGLRWDELGWCFQAGYQANWHPLTWMSHMLDCQLFGLNPSGPHVVNVIFHICASVLLFLVLNQMTGAFWRSAMVGALFAWHPLHVESVAWISERKDVLSGLFFMLTIWAYIRFVSYT